MFKRIAIFALVPWVIGVVVTSCQDSANHLLKSVKTESVAGSSQDASEVSSEVGIFKFDKESFSRLIDFRVGEGEEKFFYTFGDVRTQPGGEVIYQYEGIEACKLAPQSRTESSATQISRRIFFYIDPKTGEYIREIDGRPVQPTAYPYLIMNWSLENDGGALIKGTQGTVPRVVTVTTQIPTLRKLSNGVMHFPVNLFFQAGSYSFHEIGNYVSLSPNSSLSQNDSGHFVRLQAMPSWAANKHTAAEVLLDLSVQNMSSFENLPKRLREVIRNEFPQYTKPPRDLDECKRIQQGEPSPSH